MSVDLYLAPSCWSRPLSEAWNEIWQIRPSRFLSFRLRSPLAFFSSPSCNLESCKIALAFVPQVPAPSECPTGIDGHLQTPSSLVRALYPPPWSLSWRTPFYTILFYLLPLYHRHRRRRLCSPGAFAGASLLSSNPTPFYKYITRPSGPLPLFTPEPLISRRIVVPSKRFVVPKM